MRERNFEETFQRNFISSVAFEVVFIPLMKIAALIPNFQEKIRDDLPNYQYGFPINVERSIQIPEELSDWIFSSNDEKSYVKVAINRVAYIQTFYDGFENFTNQVNKYLKAFQEITKINKYKRIGLRYKNEFIFEDKSKSLDDTLVYFNPYINNELIKNEKPFRFTSELRKDEEQNKITCWNIFETTKNEITRYIIDIDSFCEKEIEKNGLVKKLDELHKLAIQEFHRNVKEKFLSLMRS